MKITRLIFILMALSAVIFSGCYTMLAHPGEDDGGSFGSRSRDSDCISCHPGYHENYGYSHYYYPDYWESNTNWGHYYAEPWWWDSYWYSDDEYYYEEDSDNPRADEGLKPVRPGTRYQTGGGNYGGGTTTVTRGSSSSSSSSGTTSSGKTTSSTDDKKEVKTKQKNKDTDSDKNKKPTRRTGRWKKK